VEHNSLEKLLSVKDGIAICWLGNLSWLIYAEGRLMAFDLDLDHERRMSPSPIPTSEIAKALDVQFITHEHDDHFSIDSSAILAKESNCLFVIPKTCIEKAQKLGIPEHRLHVASPGNPFDLPGVQVEPQRALHGHLRTSVYIGASMDDCGYILTVAGKRIYQPGDTVLLHEQLEMNNIDVLFVSPTEHNTYVNNSVELINAINPSYILPQHYGTYIQDEENYFWTKGYADELKAELPEKMKQRYHKLEQGEVFIIK
jgi:L-ascorbate 6-phosphate lactonase